MTQSPAQQDSIGSVAAAGSILASLPLARHAVDRDYAARSRDDLLEELVADDAARVLVLSGGKALMRDASGRSLRLVPASHALESTLRVYLGRTTVDASGEPAGTPVVASVLSAEAAAALEPDESNWGSLRTAALTLSERDTGLFTEALAIVNWHEVHGFSPRTGEPTIIEEAGWVRRAPSDGSQVFPRTDPAIIVCVLDADDRLLLGSNAMWGIDRFSLLAGFVEPGESLESAVVREMFEESGLRVVDPVYLGSQPWPFPASIMVGFTARLAHDESPDSIQPDGTEILDLRWFSRDELRAAVGSVVLPGRTSIARAMIENWLGEPIEDEPTTW